MQADGHLVLVLKAAWVINAPAPALLSSARALVVDDSLTARALHRAILEAGGYVVHTASGGQQALADLEVASYDVVVCDVSMAPMDGFEFVAASDIVEGHLLAAERESVAERACAGTRTQGASGRGKHCRQAIRSAAFRRASGAEGPPE